jgi:hypothetical protein
MDIETFFRRIDSDLVQYADVFRQLGFTSSQTMKYWREEDFGNLQVNVPEGQRRLILNMIIKLRTPEVKFDRHSTHTFPKSTWSPEKDCFRSRGDIAVNFTDMTKSQLKKTDTSINREKLFSSNHRKLDTSPVERYIQSKEQEMFAKKRWNNAKKTRIR